MMYSLAAEVRIWATILLAISICQQQIQTFIGNDRPKRTDKNSDDFSKATNESKISVIILSEKYVSSNLCLDELVNILERKKMNGHMVIPIFYHITPSEVRQQNGSLKDAFIKHENPEKVQKRKAALTKVSYLSGWESTLIRPESKLVDEIVKSILKNLSSETLHTDGSLLLFSSMVSSSSTSSITYDVFLSFRGIDTRDNFTSHLYAALCRQQIQTFIDDDGIKRGDEILALKKAIEQSKISIVIFSKDYASSIWCLYEIEKIIHCHETKGHIVIPIFYHVNKLDVREQSGSFKIAFDDLEKDFKMPEKVQRWKVALHKASLLPGWSTEKIRPESNLVNEIVGDVLKKLKQFTMPRL